jgi:hypothetical protein
VLLAADEDRHALRDVGAGEAHVHVELPRDLVEPLRGVALVLELHAQEEPLARVLRRRQDVRAVANRTRRRRDDPGLVGSGDDEPRAHAADAIRGR